VNTQFGFRKDDIEAYVKDSGCHCPYCWSNKLEGGDFDTSTTSYTAEVRQLVHCIDCGKVWVDVYSLSSIEKEEK